MRKFIAEVETTPTGYRLMVDGIFLGSFVTEWEANGARLTAGVVQAMNASQASAVMMRRLELSGFMVVN